MYQPPSPIRIDRDSGEVELVVRKGAQITKPTNPTGTDRDSGAVVSGVGGAQGRRTQTDRIMGTEQDEVLEESAMLVKYRTGLTVEVEVGRRRKERKLIVGMGENEIFVKTVH